MTRRMYENRQHQKKPTAHTVSFNATFHLCTLSDIIFLSLPLPNKFTVAFFYFMTYVYIQFNPLFNNKIRIDSQAQPHKFT